jgi:alanine or glycine:cation symporter, AGCS family
MSMFSFTCLDTIDWLLGLPLIIYAVSVGLFCTVAFRFIQFRLFMRGWRLIFNPGKEQSIKGDMSPMQAFINTLSTNLGNGSVVGSAVAVFCGGPGAGFWVITIGLVLMSIRFAEVYLSTLYGARAPKGTVLGGPMLYLRNVIGGKILAPLYAGTCLIFGLVVGNAMQTHSISWSIQTATGLHENMIAVVISLFVLYVVLGGAGRVVALSNAIVPVKVVVFFTAALAIILFHIKALPAALSLIIQSALSQKALAGGSLGFSVTHAIRHGMNLSITATESGLGTAGILFGYTGDQDPVDSGLLGMISTFVSSLVCFLVVLCIVISGVWDSGLTSAKLTIAAFNTLFGMYGSWIVSFLSISFGLGVLVAYAYICRAAWFSLTNGRFVYTFMAFYTFAAGVGAVIDVNTIWLAIAIMNGAMLVINLFGLLYLMPFVSKQIWNK